MAEERRQSLSVPSCILQVAHAAIVEEVQVCLEFIAEYHLFGYRFARSSRFSMACGFQLTEISRLLVEQLDDNPDDVYLLLAALLKAPRDVRCARFPALIQRCGQVDDGEGADLVRAVEQLDGKCENEYLPTLKSLHNLTVREREKESAPPSFPPSLPPHLHTDPGEAASSRGGRLWSEEAERSRDEAG